MTFERGRLYWLHGEMLCLWLGRDGWEPGLERVRTRNGVVKVPAAWLTDLPQRVCPRVRRSSRRAGGRVRQKMALALHGWMAENPKAQG